MLGPSGWESHTGPEPRPAPQPLWWGAGGGPAEEALLAAGCLLCSWSGAGEMGALQH